MSDIDPNEKLAAASLAVAEQLDADVYLYSGGIDRSGARRFVREVCKDTGPTRGGCLLILGTRGGDADAAYKIARIIKEHYNKFTLLIPGLCKSAGSLIAVGADELIIADDGELGPLDVQLGKRDELFEYSSGLDINQALLSLNIRARAAFREALIEIRTGSGGAISTKMASEIAANLATNLYGRIYEQIDPVKLGENERAIQIATHYGDRLKGSNVKKDTLEMLVLGYSSHGFVIDRKEAEGLFRFVRAPRKEEADLIAILNGAIFHNPSDDAPPLIQKLKSRQEPANEATTQDQNTGGADDQRPRGAGHHAPADSTATDTEIDGGQRVTKLRPPRP